MSEQQNGKCAPQPSASPTLGTGIKEAGRVLPSGQQTLARSLMTLQLLRAGGRNGVRSPATRDSPVLGLVIAAATTPPPAGVGQGLGFAAHSPPGAAGLRVHHLADDALPRVPLLLCHGLHGLDARLLLICQDWTGRRQGGGGRTAGRAPSRSRPPRSTVPGPSSSSPADRCHWSSEGPGRASGGGTFAFSLPFFFSFFFLFFFFFLFLSLCFPDLFRPWPEDEEEEEEELGELEEEEEELERGLLRAWCLLLSVRQGGGEAGRP